MGKRTTYTIEKQKPVYIPAKTLKIPHTVWVCDICEVEKKNPWQVKPCVSCKKTVCEKCRKYIQIGIELFKSADICIKCNKNLTERELISIYSIENPHILSIYDQLTSRKIAFTYRMGEFSVKYKGKTLKITKNSITCYYSGVLFDLLTSVLASRSSASLLQKNKKMKKSK